MGKFVITRTTRSQSDTNKFIGLPEIEVLPQVYKTREAAEAAMANAIEAEVVDRNEEPEEEGYYGEYIPGMIAFFDEDDNVEEAVALYAVHKIKEKPESFLFFFKTILDIMSRL